jgi:Na+-driven multidrug efflux pump
VQATVARRAGEERLELTGSILNAGILLATLAGLCVTALGYLLLALIFGVINNDPQVVEQGLTYLSTRLPSILFIGINIAFRSYWVGVSQATGDTCSALRLTVLPQWLIMLPLPAPSVWLGYGLQPAMLIFLFSTIAAAMWVSYTWHKERWSSISI